MLFLQCVMIFDIFVIVMLLAWLIWAFTGDDEAFQIIDFQLEPGPDHNFLARKYLIDCKTCLTAIDLNNEAIWRAQELEDYYLIDFLVETNHYNKEGFMSDWDAY